MKQFLYKLRLILVYWLIGDDMPVVANVPIIGDLRIDATKLLKRPGGLIRALNENESRIIFDGDPSRIPPRIIINDEEVQSENIGN